MTLKSDILAATKCDEKDATLAGHKVRIRGLTTDEEIRFIPVDGENDTVGVCSACIIDADGQPMFTRDEIRSMKSGALTAILKEILSLSFPKAKETRKNS